MVTSTFLIGVKYQKATAGVNIIFAPNLQRAFFSKISSKSFRFNNKAKRVIS